MMRAGFVAVVASVICAAIALGVETAGSSQQASGSYVPHQPGGARQVSPHDSQSDVSQSDVSEPADNPTDTPPKQASRPPRHHRRAHRYLHHDVPRCRYLQHAQPGARMLTASTGGTSPLANGITRLICSAADGATIDIKSMFVLAGKSHFMHRLANDLQLMHTYYHVRVNMFVDRSVYSPLQWSAFRAMFPFARVGWCVRSCHSQVVGAYSHSKWITVSQLAASLGGGPAVMSTSANLSTQQFSASQSGILTTGNEPLYRAFVSEWDGYQRCRLHKPCAGTQRVAQWRGSNGVEVYFSPASNNPIVHILSQLECTAGSSVSLMSMGIQQPKFVKGIATLLAKGCRVRILLNPRIATQIKALSGATTRCQPLQHDKVVLINAGGKRLVVAGSLDFNARAEYVNDNQMIRTDDPSVWSGYQAYFDQAWQRAGSCS